MRSGKRCSMAQAGVIRHDDMMDRIVFAFSAIMQHAAIPASTNDSFSLIVRNLVARLA